MLVTLLGIIMLASFSQPQNAELPMLVTLLPIVTLVRLFIFNWRIIRVWYWFLHTST